MHHAHAQEGPHALPRRPRRADPHRACGSSASSTSCSRPRRRAATCRSWRGCSSSCCSRRSARSPGWSPAGRGTRSHERPSRTPRRAIPEYDRPNRYVPSNPDDDEEFLAGLRKRAEEQRRRARDAAARAGRHAGGVTRAPAAAPDFRYWTGDPPTPRVRSPLAALLTAAACDAGSAAELADAVPRTDAGVDHGRVHRRPTPPARRPASAPGRFPGQPRPRRRSAR